MLTINFQHLFEIAQSSASLSLTESELQQNNDFTKHLTLLKSRQQGFLDLPYQEIDVFLDFAQSVQGKYDQIVILGIGGSMLGPQCVVQSLYHHKQPEVIFLDNIDPFLIEQINSQLDLERTLFLVQTKSGTTPETLAQYFYFREKVEKIGLKVAEHFVFVTDPVKGYLRQVGNEENIKCFEIPSNVGGRFSVLSSVGLLVSALIGLDIKSMLAGAREATERYLQDNLDAYNLAQTQYLLSKKGKNITVLMPYSSQLKTVANWYVQLLSESVGKEFDLKGNLVNVGITPLPSLGATDQHSQLQLFKEGPNDKLIVFLQVQDHTKTALIPEKFTQNPEFSYLHKQSFNSLLEAEFVGTRQSLSESKRANLTVSLPKVDEFYLGQLFQMLEISVAFLGEMLEIDTFNQPGVERSKVLARETLLAQ